MLNFFYRLQEKPVIVLGNQKSGTTAIAALLAKRTGLSATLDTSVVWEPNLTSLFEGNLTLAEIVRKNKQPFSKKIIKEPNLTFFTDDLFQIFPKATYVFIVRDPRDNIRSLLNRIGVRGDLEALVDLEAVPPTWRPLFDDRFASSGHYIDCMAGRWNYCVSQYRKAPSRYLLVRYEDFVKDKSSAIDALCDKLGLDKLHSIAQSVDKQFQPKGNHAVSWLEFFGSANYEKITVLTGEYARELGYEL